MSGKVFPSTHWSRILSAREAPELEPRILEELMEVYWSPLYIYARKKGVDRETAQDLVQGLFARLLEQEFLQGLDPHRGRLRAYLKAALDRHAINEHARETARKRGGELTRVSWDLERVEASLARGPEDAERAFDREWAVGVFERALGHLLAEFEAGTRRGPITVAMKFFRPQAPPSYAEAASEAGMTENGFRSFLHRTRRRLKELLRREVAPTVADPAQTDQEMQDLMGALGR